MTVSKKIGGNLVFTSNFTLISYCTLGFFYGYTKKALML